MVAITRRGFVKGAALAPLALGPFSLGQQNPPPAPGDRYDIVVAGAGHNSLITAAYLVKAGYRCVVLEGRPIIGGGVKTAEVSLVGFQHDLCSSAHTAIFDNPLMRDDELKLGDYGLEYIQPDPIFHMPFPDGSYITQWRDAHRTAAEFGKFSKKDEAAYLRMMEEFEAVDPILQANTFSPIGFGKAVNERLAEIPHGKLWQRRLAMSAWEIIRDNFEDDHCARLHAGVTVGKFAAGESHDRARSLRHLPSAAPQPAASERRVRHVDRGAGPLHRGARWSDSPQQAGCEADCRGRQVRRRRMRRWKFLSRAKGGRFHHPHQAIDRHGSPQSRGDRTSSTESTPGKRNVR